MPLMPRDGGQRHRITITAAIDPASAGDWYEIKTALGYYDRLQANAARGLSFKLPADKLQRGEVPGGNQLVTVSMDNLADAAHIKLMVWLSAWSHPEPITSATVRRIPESHVRVIQDAIARFEARQGAVLPDDDPLPAGSAPSSGSPSGVGHTSPAEQPNSTSTG